MLGGLSSVVRSATCNSKSARLSSSILNGTTNFTNFNSLTGVSTQLVSTSARTVTTRSARRTVQSQSTATLGRSNGALNGNSTVRSNGAVNRLPEFICEKTAVERIASAQTGKSQERSFFINDVGIVERQYQRWVRELPTVRPFYAVKCNPDEMLLRVLSSSGAGFDCASGAEMASCLKIGVVPQDIIFANPIKNAADLRYAKQNNILKMTFDNEAELYKIAEHHPQAELVIRLLPDDSGSLMRFGVKFGAPQPHVRALLETAKKLNLKVIGTSFHIGSGCFDANKYESAIKMCRETFDIAAELGMPKMTFLDLGGGFPGASTPHEKTPMDGQLIPAFEEFTAVIRRSLVTHFPDSMGVQVIAEPGRYMATAWSTLFCLLQGKRQEPQLSPEEPKKFLYYINDGVYGSFNCTMFDHNYPIPTPATRFLHDRASLDRKSSNKLSAQPPASIWTQLPINASEEVRQYARAVHSNVEHDRTCLSTFFGPTCDSMDVIVKEHPMEELFVGDWLAFSSMGAYTSASSTTFNGMARPNKFYCRSHQPSPKCD